MKQTIRKYLECAACFLGILGVMGCSFVVLAEQAVEMQAANGLEVNVVQEKDTGNILNLGTEEEDDSGIDQDNNTDGTEGEDYGQNKNLGENPLILDNENTYEGMKKAYKSGYLPTIAKNKVNIVLPVYFDNQTDVNSIQAQLELGAVEGTPFIYKNYSKEVKRTKEEINGTNNVKEVFLVRFGVNLKKDRVNGVYPVILRLSYQMNSETVVQEFTVYVNITDGTSPSNAVDNESIENGEEKPSSEPKVIVEENEVSQDKIYSNSQFTSKVILKNTNKTKAIQNITVTVTSEAEGISLCADSNVFYFEEVKAGGTWELPLEFKVEEKTLEGKYAVKLAIAYDNTEGTPLSSEGTLFFQIHQNIRVSMEMGEIPSDISAGDSISLPIQVMNLGRGKIYNVRCNVEGMGLNASKSLFIGNLEGGTAGSGELVLFAGMVNPDAEEEIGRYGDAFGQIVMTYEDEEGNTYTEQQEYSTKISPLVITGNKEKGEEKEEKTIGKQMFFGIGVVIFLLGAGVMIFVVQQRRKERKQDEEY